MTYPRKHIINRADGGDLGYAFKTLWQETTNGIGTIGNTIVNGLQVTEKTKQLHDLYDIKGRQDWSVQVLETTKQNNTGNTIILALVVVAVLGTLVFIAVKQKKQ